MTDAEKHWLDEDLEHFDIETLEQLDKQWHAMEESGELWTGVFEVFPEGEPEDVHALPMLKRNEIMMAAYFNR